MISVVFVQFRHFETSSIDQSIFNCFELNSVQSVQILDSRALLQIIVPSSFTIKKLEVRKTRLHWIHFQPNDAITELMIMYSSLGQVPPSLKGLKNLITLQLLHSHIQHLNLDLIQWCHSLDSLDLTYNNIHTITSTINSGHKRNLFQLNVSHNKLRILNLELLAPLGWFNYVNLSHNAIELLVGRFSSAHLYKLMLSNNRFKTLDFCQWQTIPSLQVLYLNSNELTRIPNCMHHLPFVNYLNFSNNKLRNVNMDVFGGMDGLVSLDVSANQISFIVFREDKHPKRLERLMLSRNKIDCRHVTEFPFCPLDIEFQATNDQSSWARNDNKLKKQLIIVT
ncbi:insulin-like growth factor-binding protein complex acid labile subunit [Anopheles maculipalpis]|uniref:insulin-like growth factor-binding protein complex acid labile subunit n=1 Tax=Anopheles maculipalpis TaxID=1496333 RepID=UPI0021591F5D|nr:insulin-like growth factor-binding protein complex acid labile subunit [Anopheles maculipalpis]